MRPLLVLAMSTRVAGAEPDAAEVIPAVPTLPAPGTKGTGAPGIDDVWASGSVIEPPAHADSAEWPNGMVMTPPDPLDPNVLELGSVRLGDRGRAMLLPPATTWPHYLARRLEGGMRRFLELMTPPTL